MTCILSSSVVRFAPMNEPGTIRFNLDEILKARAWSEYRLSQESGVQRVVIAKFRNNAAPSPRLETLAKLCAALNCGIGDLMEYVPAPAATKTGSATKSPRSKKR